MIKTPEGRSNAPEAQEQHVVQLVFAEGSWNGEQEGLSEQRRAGVVVAGLLVLLPQVHRDHHVVRVLHPVHRQLKSARTRAQRFAACEWK